MESNDLKLIGGPGMSESGTEFLNDYQQPTRPAVDTPIEEAHIVTDENPLAAPPDSPAPQPAEASAPIFAVPDGPAIGVGPEQAAKPLTDKKSEAKLMFIIKMVDKMQAKGFARIAKEMDEQHWRFDEEEIAMLVDAWMPYMKEHGGNIPDWIEAAFVTIWVFGGRMYEAYDVRRANIKNEAIATTPSMQAAVARAVAIPTGKRKDYTLATTRPGYYQTDAKSGKYLRKDLVTEKADLKDIELILRDNDISVVREAFPNAIIPDAAETANG